MTGGDIKGRYIPKRLHWSYLNTVVQFLNYLFKSGNYYNSIIISALAVIGLNKDSR
jgi:hypothetical protein